MNRKKRKNRPDKKIIPQEKWDQDLENLKERYEYNGRKDKENTI